VNDEIGNRIEQWLAMAECVERKQSDEQAHQNAEYARTPQQQPPGCCTHTIASVLNMGSWLSKVVSAG